MLSGVQTGNGTSHDRYNIHSIAHTRTNRKDDIFIQRRMCINEEHTALDIFRFAVFLRVENNKLCPGGDGIKKIMDFFLQFF